MRLAEELLEIGQESAKQPTNSQCSLPVDDREHQRPRSAFPRRGRTALASERANSQRRCRPRSFRWWQGAEGPVSVNHPVSHAIGQTAQVSWAAANGRQRRPPRRDRSGSEMNQRVGATANGEQNETRLAVVGDKLLQVSLTAGFVGSVSLNSIGAWPKMPMTAGSLPSFLTPS